MKTRFRKGQPVKTVSKSENCTMTAYGNFDGYKIMEVAFVNGEPVFDREILPITKEDRALGWVPPWKKVKYDGITRAIK